MTTRSSPADESVRIVVSGVTKTFGEVRAVTDLSFTVEPGAVTGFLGPDPIDLGLGVGVEESTRKLLVTIEGDFNRIPAVLFVEDADFKVCVTGS